MTAKEMARTLNGCEYGNEMSREDMKLAKENGLVVVYGYSDDCAELEGAISDEVSCYDGGTFYVNKHGLMSDPNCGYSRCEYYQSALQKAKPITAVWCDSDVGAPWSYETDIPHETFNIYEDGELFCVGIVFSMEDV